MNNKLRPSHSGLTIIEVMTSIVVAMIGVMGVMILIPFAVRQAQTGLDTEAAAVVARNAYSLLEIGGYRNHENWILPNTNTGRIVSTDGLPAPPDVSVTPRPTPPYFPQPYYIDPLGVAENGQNYNTTTFPFNLEGTYQIFPNDPARDYRIPSVNFSLPASGIVGFDRAHARRMFQARDDLVFGDALVAAGQSDTQLLGPRQVFDQAAGVDVRRQAIGRFSWSAIAVPNKLAAAPINEVSNWKLYMLVYKDRNTNSTAQDIAPINYAFSPKMRSAQVVITPPAGVPNGAPVSTIRIGASIPVGSVKKDDWVMLINRAQPNANFPNGTGYDWQIEFYRVVNFRSQATPNESLLTLDGPDFNFDPNVYQPTFCVLLKDVVSVFERTIVPEGNSVWNLTY